MNTRMSTVGQRVTALPLAAATYFMVCGGPFGLEDSVGNLGYKITLASLVIISLVWAYPIGLMVGELSAAIPAEGGYYVWVRRAMGPFWGFQEAWLSLASSIFDMAIYPSLFVAYLGQAFPLVTQGYTGKLIAAALMFVCLLWNFSGAQKVSYGAVVLSLLLLSPFALITLFAIFRLPTPAGSVGSNMHSNLLLGALVLVWNFSGWDNAGTVAGEVENPQKTYPRVMRIAVVAVTLSYIVPIAAVWHHNIPLGHWTEASWPRIGSDIVGPWFGRVLSIMVMVSIAGTANSLVMTYSRVPLAMAQKGYLPKVFSRTLSNEAPWMSILVCGAFWIGAVLLLPFEDLIVLEVLFDSSSVALEFIALVFLRIREPDLERPFRISGGLVGSALAGVGPMLILAIAVVESRHEQVGSHMTSLTFGLIVMAAGIAVYFGVESLRRQVLSSKDTQLS